MAALPALAGLVFAASAQAPDLEPGFTSIFDGKTLDGWEGESTWFRVEEGSIVAGSLEQPTPENKFLSSTRAYGDFELRLSVKLLGDPAHANAGIQFRSRRVPNSNEMSGFQADMGQTYWGCLYDESRRNRILVQADQEAVAKVLRRDDWNEYVIRCEGRHIQLWVNGLKTVDYVETEDGIAAEGLLGLQVHQGPPSRVFYRKIRIREL